MLTKQCVQCSKTFKIEDQDVAFYNKIEVPAPTQCPTCRLIRRMVWRNERYLYSRTCGLCHKPILAMYHSAAPFPVYCSTCWWSDQWNGDDYAIELDLSKPFFEQFALLQSKVPRMAVNLLNAENSNYSNYINDSKDAYQCFGSGWLEQCYYNNWIYRCKDSMDNFVAADSELLYDCHDINRGYNLIHCAYSNNCTDCSFCFNCNNCTNCFGCVNLRNKQYCFFNEQLTADEYNRRVGAMQIDSYSGYSQAKQQVQNFSLKFFRPAAFTAGIIENSVGNHITNCHASQYIFDSNEIDQSVYIQFAIQVKDSMDCSFYGVSELGYETVASGYNNSTKFAYFSGKTNFSEYVDLCQNLNNCFGCVGLKNKQYSILNKPYSKIEYETLVAKIKQALSESQLYGEFFPNYLSPFAYNETVAADFFPQDRTDLERLGERWQDALPITIGKETIMADVIPDSIRDVLSDICSAILACTHCQRNYKIIPQELKFYKAKNIPLPRKCYTCRYQERIQLRNTYKLWQRQCMCTQIDHDHAGRCSTEFSTTYSPERKELIYCEVCYQKEIY